MNPNPNPNRPDNDSLASRGKLNEPFLESHESTTPWSLDFQEWAAENCISLAQRIEWGVFYSAFIAGILAADYPRTKKDFDP